MSGVDAIRGVCEAVGTSEPAGWRPYFDIVQAWDARTDLTSARTDTELAEILFLDAAQVIRAGWTEPSSSLVDVGAGVGAPTIPILLSDETMHATLIEPRRIRTAFLRTVAGALGIAARATMLEQKIDPAEPVVDGAPFSIALSGRGGSLGGPAIGPPARLQRALQRRTEIDLGVSAVTEHRKYRTCPRPGQTSAGYRRRLAGMI
jgi:hypothetical protein